MKTQEQQKSELCDEFFSQISTCSLTDEQICVLIAKCCIKYDEITQQKPLSQNPYVNEVFSGRLLNIISDYWGLENNERLSDLPNIIVFSDKRGFGKMMRQEYIEAMTTYEMFDKI